jgi:hypothetical protein
VHEGWKTSDLAGFFGTKEKERTMENTYFATAFISSHSVGVTIQAENIETAFERAENYLEERYPRSEVVVQAVQPIYNRLATHPNALDDVAHA